MYNWILCYTEIFSLSKNDKLLLKSMISKNIYIVSFMNEWIDMTWCDPINEIYEMS